MPETDVEESGFRPIFNGTDLEGWDYDPVYWSVRDGVMTGEVTPETLLKQNNFIIWMNDQPADFELKMDFRVSPEGNSGINYRSSRVEEQYALKGYQLDIDGKNSYTGMMYEERARQILGFRGDLSVCADGRKIVTASVGDAAELAPSQGEWHEAHIIAYGTTLVHIIDGRVTCVVVDTDRENRTTEGYIGMQTHVGPPMKIEFRNIRLKDTAVKFENDRRMKESLDEFYLALSEPQRSTFLALRDIILSHDDRITASQKYGMPCFLYGKNIMCYLWADSKTGEPYILMAEGKHLGNPLLEQGNRSRMKILRINPDADIPVRTVGEVLDEAIGLYRKGIVKPK